MNDDQDTSMGNQQSQITLSTLITQHKNEILQVEDYDFVIK